MPDRGGAAAVEQMRTQTLGSQGVARCAAVSREIPDRQRQQRLGAVANWISWRSRHAMREWRLGRVGSNRLDFAERESERFSVARGERRGVAPPRHAHGDPAGIEPGEGVGIACIGEDDRFAEPARAVTDATQLLPSLDDARAVVAEAIQKQLCSLAQLGVELERAGTRDMSRLRHMSNPSPSPGIRIIASMNTAQIRTVRSFTRETSQSCGLAARGGREGAAVGGFLV